MAKCHHSVLENDCAICNPNLVAELRQEIIDLSEGIATDPTWQNIVKENELLTKQLDDIRKMDAKAFDAWKVEKKLLMDMADKARLDATEWRMAMEQQGKAQYAILCRAEASEAIVRVAYKCLDSDADNIVKWNELCNILRQTRKEKQDEQNKTICTCSDPSIPIYDCVVCNKRAE